MDGMIVLYALTMVWALGGLVAVHLFDRDVAGGWQAVFSNEEFFSAIVTVAVCFVLSWAIVYYVYVHHRP